MFKIQIIVIRISLFAANLQMAGCEETKDWREYEILLLREGDVDILSAGFFI